MALVSMPWTLFDRPSLQLGALTAFLKRQDWIRVTAFHPYVELAKILGPDVYRWISKKHWLGEALYTPLVFPSKYDAAEDLFDRALGQLPTQTGLTYKKIQQYVSQHFDSWMASVDWTRFDLLGFSVCLSQLTASLAGASWVKENATTAPAVVFGGSSCAPERAPRIMKRFPQIDFVVRGEGELPLVSLCEYLSKRTTALGPRTFSRTIEPQKESVLHSQLKSLSQLPSPDYDDYFEAVRKSFPSGEFLPVIPIEFSRGCWWGKCTFCNLNLQWSGYRQKTAKKMFKEVDLLSTKYKCLDFAFNDNALPVRTSKDFFSLTEADPRDLSFFAEVRVSHCTEDLAVCSRGGLCVIQSGIEALSESLLKRLNKGTSAIENVAAMKTALQWGVELDGNLITEFPGSTLDDVQETLATLEFVIPYNPLSVSPFYLALGSGVDRHYAAYGIRSTESHHQDRKLFDRHLLEDQISLFRDYRGDRQKQRKLWAPVVERIRDWERFHGKRRASVWTNPPLSYRDGGDYLIIQQERPDHRPTRYRLSGVAKEIYLACHGICSIGEIHKHFGDMTLEDLRAFLDDLVQKRLMFTQDDRYIALAIQEGKRSHLRESRQAKPYV